jgi:hypothetical protein
MGLPHKSNALEGSLLALKLVDAKEQESGGKITRFRVSETTLKKLWGRKRIPIEYLLEVQEWLLDAGWALFFAGSTYAMIKVASVEGWARLGSKRIEDDIKQVSRGEYDFNKLLPLLATDRSSREEDEQTEIP